MRRTAAPTRSTSERQLRRGAPRVASVTQQSTETDSANREAVQRLIDADPILVDVAPALDVVPGMTPDTILTSGAPMPWERYFGGQRAAVIGGRCTKGLPATARRPTPSCATARSSSAACHDYGCVGSLAGIYTASMPVFVVENATHGNRAFCNFFEGPSPKRLNYGVYDDEVKESLRVVQTVIAPGHRGRGPAQRRGHAAPADHPQRAQHGRRAPQPQLRGDAPLHPGDVPAHARRRRANVARTFAPRTRS